MNGILKRVDDLIKELKVLNENLDNLTWMLAKIFGFTFEEEDENENK